MNRKKIGIIMIVLGALLAIGVGVYVYLQVQVAAELARQTPTVQVVIATVDLPARTAIPETSVAIAKLPADLVPLAAAKQLTDVVGKYPLQPIYKSEALITSKLADSAGKAGPSFTLKEGMVAVTLAGNDALTGTGAIREGDRVDLLITLPLARPQTGNSQAGVSLPQVTQTTLQNLEVLRVGAFPVAGSPDAGGGKTVTFQVGHQDALVLKWIKDSGGVIDLVLRHPSDKEAVATDPITGTYVFKKFRFTLADPIQ